MHPSGQGRGIIQEEEEEESSRADEIDRRRRLLIATWRRRRRMAVGGNNNSLYGLPSTGDGSYSFFLSFFIAIFKRQVVNLPICKRSIAAWMGDE